MEAYEELKTRVSNQDLNTSHYYELMLTLHGDVKKAQIETAKFKLESTPHG